MFTCEEISFLKQMVFDLTGCTYEGEIAVCEGTGLTLSGDLQKVTVTAESKPALARGFFRLAQEMRHGKTAFDLHEEKLFESCGAFVDFSRNAVMTVEACKRYMNHLAALGMNMMALYIEETYEVPGHPYVGYLRGRLTQSEIRELDAHAQKLGMELLPCIQTLGHLENYLQWAQTRHLQDQPSVLLVDEDETYELIEAMVKSMRECVSGHRLHVGMDEAHGVGLGRYFQKHGITDRFELLNRHLTRVVEICQKYDFHAIMWSDMFFRLGSKTNSYYDLESHAPQSVIDNLPDVDLCYWDYYNTTEDMYEHMFAEHERMNPGTVFAGGVWTWSGFLPQVELTWATMEPGLKVAAKHQVKTVLATQWGDNGNECDQFLALSQLPMFSEFCWRGECDREMVADAGELLTGLPREAYEAFGKFFPDEKDKRPGKELVYCDLLYPIGPDGAMMDICLPRYEEAIETLKPLAGRLECRYALSLFELAAEKIRAVRVIRPAYLRGDQEAMLDIARRAIPLITEKVEALEEAHRTLWERDYRRNGWEVLALRYGAVRGRLRDVARAIERWASGELDTLCELDEEPMDSTRAKNYAHAVSPMYII